MYIKYKLQKKQVSHDGGVTWVDVVPLEERVGESAGTYSTLEECEADYSTQYLTIESLEDNNTIYWKYEIAAKTISASTDNGQTWSAYTSTSSGKNIATLNTGDKVLLKGLDSTYNYNHFTSSGEVVVYGNIMSLLYGDNFENQTTLTDSKTFPTLFMGCNVISAENLILPATTLAESCYYRMFNNCSGLTTAPELPATTLAEYCYVSMFENCTSLTKAPELPATTLAEYCYHSMFEQCTSLTTAPSVLPATTLADSCYQYMFQGCTSLTTAPELPATTLEEFCYEGMFYACTSLDYIKCLATDISATDCTRDWVFNVAALGTFVKASSMGDWTSGTDGIPNSWTVQNA